MVFFTFFTGIMLLIAGFTARVSDGLHRLLVRTGWLCLAVVAVLGDFHAPAAALLFVIGVVAITVFAFLYWLDGGRFTEDRMRASVGWFFAVSGPGAPPIRHGFLGIVVLTVIVLTALLIVRPVARTAMGLETPPEFVMTERGYA